MRVASSLLRTSATELRNRAIRKGGFFVSGSLETTMLKNVKKCKKQTLLWRRLSR